MHIAGNRTQLANPNPDPIVEQRMTSKSKEKTCHGIKQRDGKRNTAIAGGVLVRRSNGDLRKNSLIRR